MYYKGQQQQTVNTNLEARQSTIYQYLQQFPTVYNAEIERGLGLALSNDDNNRVSFARTIELLINDDRRTKVKLGRYIRKYLELDNNVISDEELRKIVAFVMVKYSSYTIDIVEGVDIIQAYQDQFGCSSCMTNNNRPNELLKLYAENSDKVKLLKLTDTNNSETEGRALIWFLDDDIIVIDRFYHNTKIDDYVVLAKVQELYESKKVILAYKLDSKVEVELTQTEFYPYLDSFRYARFEDGNKIILSNQSLNCTHHLSSENGAVFNL